MRKLQKQNKDRKRKEYKKLKIAGNIKGPIWMFLEFGFLRVTSKLKEKVEE